MNTPWFRQKIGALNLRKQASVKFKSFVSFDENLITNVAFDLTAILFKFQCVDFKSIIPLARRDM